MFPEGAAWLWLPRCRASPGDRPTGPVSPVRPVARESGQAAMMPTRDAAC